MDSTNTEELKLLIKNKLDNLTNLSKAKTSIKDAPQCTYINMNAQSNVLAIDQILDVMITSIAKKLFNVNI